VPGGDPAEPVPVAAPRGRVLTLIRSRTVLEQVSRFWQRGKQPHERVKRLPRVERMWLGEG